MSTVATVVMDNNARRLAPNPDMAWTAAPRRVV